MQIFIILSFLFPFVLCLRSGHLSRLPGIKIPLMLAIFKKRLLINLMANLFWNENFAWDDPSGSAELKNTRDRFNNQSKYLSQQAEIGLSQAGYAKAVEIGGALLLASGTWAYSEKIPENLPQAGALAGTFGALALIGANIISRRDTQKAIETYTAATESAVASAAIHEAYVRSTK